jgi:lysophospholipase L1-like esterase
MSDPTLPRRSRSKRRWWLILPSLLVALVIAEIVLRIAQPSSNGGGPAPEFFGTSDEGLLHVRSSVEGLNYEMAPSRDATYQGVRVRTNSLGMRDNEVTSRKPSGELRIAALGDSVTFGWALDVDASWPAVLERAIREHRPCDVMNFGVSGYSLRDDAVVLRAKALALEPDVIVVGYFLNDPEADAISPLHAFFRDAPWWEKTRLWMLAARQKRKHDLQELGGGNFYRWLHNPDGAPWHSAVSAFEDMSQSARDARVNVLVAIFPTWFGYANIEAYPYADLHAQVAAEAERHGMKALDLVPAFRASGLSLADLKIDDEHPSLRGHEIAARAILARLQELNWLEPRR